MIALLLACTRALDPGASAVLGAAKDGTTGANVGDAIVRNAGATKGAAGHAAVTGGAVYEGTATDGAAASGHATGRAAFVLRLMGSRGVAPWLLVYRLQGPRP